MIIDEKISWKSQIKHVQTKMSRCIAVLNKAKHALDHKSLRTLYCTLVLPYLIYCVEVWGNNYMTTIHPLLILQKKAIRIIHGAGYRDHTNSLFLQSKLIKFKDLVDFHTAQILFKAKNNLLPENIQTLFTGREGGYNLRGKFKFKILKARTTGKTFCISICGVKLWNSLEGTLRECPNINQFKKKYKEMIFTRYTNEEGV